VRQGEHAGAFVSVNYENLLQNIDQGEGEYLEAFGTILHVPSAEQRTFAVQLQRQYAHLSSIPVSQDDSHVKQFIHQAVWVTTHSSSPQF